MLARFIEEWGGPLRSGQRPEPEASDGEVLVQVEACGVGLTVLNCLRGDLGNDPSGLPRIPGHELVGTVSKLGPGVDPGLIGRRVMAYFYLSCGWCSSCVASAESMCTNLSGQIGVHRDGGYGERVALPAFNVIPLPDGIDAVAATAIPDAIATPVHVAGRAAIRPSDRVAVIAAGGGVGVHMVQVARVFGGEVVGLDVTTAKLDFLERELGVHAIDSGDFGTVQLPRAWNQGPDVIIDLLGSRASLAWSLRNLGPGGRLVLLTTFRDTTLEISPREMVFRQQSVIASRYASRSDAQLAARLVGEGRLRPIIGGIRAAHEVDELHDMLRAGTLLGRGALTWPS